MLLVLIAIFGYEVPSGSRFLVISILAFGIALSSAFLGGSAAARGRIHLPYASDYPFEFSAAGGVGIFLIVMVIGNILFSTDEEQKSLPSGHVVLFDGWSRYSESGFNFSSRSIVPWNSGQADILVSNSVPPGPNANFFVQYQIPPYDEAPQDEGARGGIVQITHSRLDNVYDCPLEGYSGHWIEVRSNNIYCLRTRDGRHYAKLKVSSVFADRISFDWVFQPNGSNRFK